MNLSDAGARFIAAHEGLRLEVYDDPAGFATIGIGHLIAKRKATAADRAQWGKLTETQAFDLFRSDARRFIDAVAAAVTVPITQNQFDALVSFAFNVGEGAFRQSTLLRKLNAGDYRGAAVEFAKWNKAGGRVLAGLVRRRKEEAELFMRATAGQVIDIPVAAASSIKPINGESLEVTSLRGYLKASGVPHRITSTVRSKLPSKHAQKGTDGQGLAIDAAGPKPARNTPEMLAIFEAFEPVEHMLYELIYSGAPYSIKRGKRVPRYAVGDHWDHVHASVDKGVLLPMPIKERKEVEMFIADVNGNACLFEGGGIAVHLDSQDDIDRLRAAGIPQIIGSLNPDFAESHLVLWNSEEAKVFWGKKVAVDGQG